jgi:hypothetical protein
MERGTGDPIPESTRAVGGVAAAWLVRAVGGVAAAWLVRAVGGVPVAWSESQSVGPARAYATAVAKSMPRPSR